MGGKPRTVFLGTPEFSVPILEALAKHTEVMLVITQPDRGSGRGRKVALSPVKSCALDLGLAVIQPTVVKGRRFTRKISKYEPDFLVTAAFGRVLGPSLLQVPAKAALNVHASLLPRHRGAAPINWAIARGDKVTGVSIMRMEVGLDTGPVYLRAETEIGADETAGTLTNRLARLGANTLIDAIGRFAQLEPTPQDSGRATWAPMLRKSDGIIDWDRSAVDLCNHVRAMCPWPCASTLFEGNPLKIFATQVISTDPVDRDPGYVLNVGKQGLDVACGLGVLRVVELQAPGKKRLNAAQFLTGCRIHGDTKLGI